VAATKTLLDKASISIDLACLPCQPTCFVGLQALCVATTNAVVKGIFLQTNIP
jgi:hypothetical protein